MTTSKNNIKNAAQPTAAILMTSPSRDDKDDVIDAKLDSFADDIDGQCYTLLGHTAFNPRRPCGCS